MKPLYKCAHCGCWSSRKVLCLFCQELADELTRETFRRLIAEGRIPSTTH